MDFVHRHDWNLSPSQAIMLQNQMVNEVIYDRPLNFSKIHLVAGVDVSVKENVSQAAVVVVSYPDLKPVETVLWQMATPFPYIPGLLSFREGPVLEDAFRKLQHVPDVLIFDGMGRAHPRRFGIASHLGVWLQKPTIGCGKTMFVGKYVEPPNERGSYSDLVDKGEIIGAILRTRTGVKPVYISVGHLANLPTAIDMVMNCTGKYRLPEPIRLAHNAAGNF
ncbi:MAG: deoxyribonuclease V [Chloroflexota bacterium]